MSDKSGPPDADVHQLPDRDPGDGTLTVRQRKVLDVIFASPGLRAEPHVPLEIAEADLVAGSDHRPTWVDIRLGEPSAAQDRADVAAAQVSESVTDEMVQEAESGLAGSAGSSDLA